MAGPNLNSAPLYGNGDGTASGRFPGNPFIDCVIRKEGDDCLELRFVNVLNGSKLAEVKLKSRLNMKGETEFGAEDSEWVVGFRRSGKAKLACFRRVGGDGLGGSDLDAALGL